MIKLRVLTRVFHELNAPTSTLTGQMQVEPSPTVGEVMTGAKTGSKVGREVAKECGCL